MIRYKALRSMFDGHLREAHQNNRSLQSARVAGLRELFDTIGLTMDEQSFGPATNLDERGLPVLKEGRAQSIEVDFRELAEAIAGHDFVDEFYHPSSGYSFAGQALREAAIDPTAFINVSTINL